MSQPQIRLVAYIRVSKVAGRTGDSFQSPGEQRSAIEHIVALTPGAQVIDWIEELDESGGSMERPGVQRAIRAVDDGQADGIVMAYLSRWARTADALTKIEQWAKQGKVFLSAQERFDTSTSHGMFALGMMLLVAKYERDRHIETWDASTRNAIERGVATVAPYGYRRSNGRGSTLELDPATAGVVRRIFDDRLRGLGISEIARGLNTEGVPAPRSTEWTRQTIRALLRVSTYTGEARYGVNVQPDAHPAIVAPDEWDRAQPNRGSWSSPGKSLLSGLVRCAGCGYRMGAGSNSHGRRYNCGRHHADGRCPSPTTAPADRLESLVAAAFLHRYGSTATDGPSVTDTAVELASAAQQRLQVEYVAWRDDATMRDALGDEEYRAGLLARKRATDEASEHHEEAVRNASAASLRVDDSLWSSATVAERRELLAAGVESVVLRRAASTRTPLAERFEIVWAGEPDPA